jgi:hypothetical protein
MQRGLNVAAGLSLNDLQRLIDEEQTHAADLEKRRAAVAAEANEIDVELGRGPD